MNIYNWKLKDERWKSKTEIWELKFEMWFLNFEKWTLKIKFEKWNLKFELTLVPKSIKLVPCFTCQTPRHQLVASLRSIFGYGYWSWCLVSGILDLLYGIWYMTYDTCYMIPYMSYVNSLCSHSLLCLFCRASLSALIQMLLGVPKLGVTMAFLKNRRISQIFFISFEIISSFLEILRISRNSKFSLVTPVLGPQEGPQRTLRRILSLIIIIDHA